MSVDTEYGSNLAKMVFQNRYGKQMRVKVDDQFPGAIWGFWYDPTADGRYSSVTYTYVSFPYEIDILIE